MDDTVYVVLWDNRVHTVYDNWEAARKKADRLEQKYDSICHILVRTVRGEAAG